VKGPGYTVNDLVYWGGFILTTAAVHLTLMATTEWHRLVILLISAACGFVVGTAAELLFRRARRGGDSTREPERKEEKDGGW
jgi:hypothetical protein